MKDFRQISQDVARDEAEEILAKPRCPCPAPKVAHLRPHGTWEYFACVVCEGLVDEELLQAGQAVERTGRLH